MPQLDKVSFLSQFFWLCVFFFGFYIFQLKYFLPEISRILKFRKKRLSESSAFTLQEESSKVRNSASTVLENLLKNSKNVFKSSSSTSDNWFSNYADKLNQNNFKKSNVRYLQSIAEKSLSNNLAILAVNNNDFSEKIFSSRLIEHLLKISQPSLAIANSSQSVLQSTPLRDTNATSSDKIENNQSRLHAKNDKLSSNFLKSKNEQDNKSSFLSSAKGTQKKNDKLTSPKTEVNNNDKDKNQSKSTLPKTMNKAQKKKRN